MSHMPVKQQYTVRSLDPEVVELIQEWAARCHVSQGEVIAQAVVDLVDDIDGGRKPFPPGWRIPRTA